MSAMHGKTTAKDIFLRLCNADEHAGLSWGELVGITTDGAPSMRGSKKCTGGTGSEKAGGRRCESCHHSAVRYSRAGVMQ